MQRPTCNVQHASCNVQHATCNGRHATVLDDPSLHLMQRVNG
jgi:hypothetical protein